MFYMYLDESGDLGFDFINRNGSKYFIVGILSVNSKSDRDKIAAAAKRTLKNKINHKRKTNVNELKGSRTSFDVKKYLFRRIETIDFKIHCLVLDKYALAKSFIDSHLTKDRIYNHAAKMLLDNVDLSAVDTSVSFVLDKCKTKKQIKEFNNSISSQIKAKLDLGVNLDIDHLNSDAELCLGVIDLFCYGIARKYEFNDVQWYEIFRDKISCEVLCK